MFLILKQLFSKYFKLSPMLIGYVEIFFCLLFFSCFCFYYITNVEIVSITFEDLVNLQTINEIRLPALSENDVARNAYMYDLHIVARNPVNFVLVDLEQLISGTGYNNFLIKPDMDSRTIRLSKFYSSCLLHSIASVQADLVLDLIYSGQGSWSDEFNLLLNRLYLEAGFLNVEYAQL